jgi:hypothetical protein
MLYKQEDACLLMNKSAPRISVGVGTSLCFLLSALNFSSFLLFFIFYSWVCSRLVKMAKR